MIEGVEKMKETQRNRTHPVFQKPQSFVEGVVYLDAPGTV
jgi:hypothetical protein